MSASRSAVRGRVHFALRVLIALQSVANSKKGQGPTMSNNRRAACVWTVLGVLAAASGTAYGQWPQFRGPNGSGVDSGVGYPVTFSPVNNVAWKTTVPYGQSSPVVAGGRVYLTG